ncbi:MAG: FAD-dependent oxidoreductase [Mariprofundaceae bacterium]|nr:FAD-dependent oxidoreductase [Mariprofundaceae bacterium]
MHEKTVDMLIVGGGLAGSLLAWQCIQQGKKIHLIFDPKTPSASKVAAGIINPVTGQRLVLQNNARTLLNTCKSYYQSLGAHFNTTFFFEKPMLRYLRNAKEAVAWEKRRANPDYDDYLEETDDPKVILQHHTGYLDTQALLCKLHHEFKHQGVLEHATMQCDEIDMYASHIRWRHITAQRIIFCEGWRGQNNPWFRYLPFQPAKGEILDLKTSSISPEYIINCGRWLLATHDGRLRLGATYDVQQPLNEWISPQAKDTLLADLKDMPISLEDIEVVQQQAGIRPNTLDKQPFLGFHPKHHALGIFNGFGSKGSMLIPYYAGVFIEHIQQQKLLPKSVDIQRFTCA